MRKIFAITLTLTAAAVSFAQRNDDVPRFAIGTFSGYSDWQKVSLQLTITNDNQITFVKRNDRGEFKDYPAYYRDGALRTGNTIYYLSADGSGLHLENRNTRQDSITLRRGALPDYRNPREDNFPANSSYVGTFNGTDRNTQYSVQIRQDRSATLSQRVGPNANSWKGFLRGDTLDFDWIEYRVRFVRDGMEIQNRKNDRQTIYLKRSESGDGGWGNPGPLPDRYNLRVDSPRNNERIDGKDLKLNGTSNAPDVKIEIYGPDGKMQSRTDRVDRDGRWSVSFNRLTSGTYDIVVYGVRDRQNVSSQKMRVTLSDRDGRRDNLSLDSPRGDYRPGGIPFSGETNGDRVRIEVYRGRDRVFSGQVQARDGRFTSSVDLKEGRYEATVYAIRDGRTIAEKRVTVNVRN